jgi:hypothetical protein
MILQPLLVEDLPEADYFAHPALSCSGAKRILSPGCPALFAYEREHGRPDKREFDEGHAAHQQILGTGAPITVLDAYDYKKPATQQAAKDVRAAGGIPVHRKQWKMVTEMRNALRRHPVVGKLFDPDRGRAEVSLFWHDERYGVDRKCRLDWLPNIVEGQSLIIPDYKTTTSASPESLSRSVANFGYHMQHAWYVDAVEAVLGVSALFVFVAQEKSPPYLVTPFEIDQNGVETGRAKNDAALEMFADCTSSGFWPSWSADEIVSLSLPRWADRDYT